MLVTPRALDSHLRRKRPDVKIYNREKVVDAFVQFSFYWRGPFRLNGSKEMEEVRNIERHLEYFIGSYPYSFNELDIVKDSIESLCRRIPSLDTSQISHTIDNLDLFFKFLLEFSRMCVVEYVKNKEPVSDKSSGANLAYLRGYYDNIKRDLGKGVADEFVRDINRVSELRGEPLNSEAIVAKRLTATSYLLSETIRVLKAYNGSQKFGDEEEEEEGRWKLIYAPIARYTGLFLLADIDEMVSSYMTDMGVVPKVKTFIPSEE